MSRLAPTSKAALEWGLKWGKDLQYLEDLRASGVDVAALDNRPELGSDLEYILSLFRLASHSRPPAFAGLAGIRVTDIEAVYRLCEVTIMPPEEFVDLMLFLDSVVIEWHGEQEKQRKRSKNGDG